MSGKPPLPPGLRLIHARVGAIDYNGRFGVGLHQRIILAGKRMGTALVAMRGHALCTIFVILLVRQLLCDIACIGEG